MRWSHCTTFQMRTESGLEGHRGDLVTYAFLFGVRQILAKFGLDWVDTRVSTCYQCLVTDGFSTERRRQVCVKYAHVACQQS